MQTASPGWLLISSLCKLKIAWDCVGGNAGSCSARDATVPIATHQLPFLVFPFPLIRQDNTQIQDQLTVPRCGTVCVSTCLGTYPLLEAVATSIPCPALLRALCLLAGKVSSPPGAPGSQEKRQDSAKLLHTHALEEAVSMAHEVYSTIANV